MRQPACLVINPITVNDFAPLFNCTPVGFKDGPNIKLVDLFKLVGTGQSCLLLGHSGFNHFFCVCVCFFFFFICSSISVVLFHTLGFSSCHNTFLSSPHL